MGVLKANDAKLATKRNCHMNVYELSQDLSLEEKIRKAEDLIEKENQSRREIVKKLLERESQKNIMLWELRKMPSENEVYCNYNMRMEAIQYFQRVLHRFHLEESAYNQHTIEMNRLSHKLQHGRNTLVGEKKISRAIKLGVDEGREKLLTDTDAGSYNQWIPWGITQVIKSKQPIEEIIKSKELIKEQIKLLFREMEDGIRKQKLAYNTKEKMLEGGIKGAEKDINSLERKLEDVIRRKLQLYSYVLELKK